MTLEHKISKTALDLVKKRLGAEASEYRSFCEGFPTMLRTSGLAQTLASRPKDATTIASVIEALEGCGAVEAYVADASDEFANEYCVPTLKANALYQGHYPLVSAISRPVIVKHLVKAAREFGATTVAHGCTGKGNDQVRFEVGIQTLGPDLKCIAPGRDLALTRDKAIAYA